MWAHCFRLNAGINTNMALESLNNLLKTNIKRNANITVEHLLDKLEDLVDAKMWKRILNMERPNANNYQDKITIKAHRIAATMDKSLVTEINFGLFQVQSTRGNEVYNIAYNEICEQQCKTGFCRLCKICIHRYRCDCQQYLVKTTICKHIHLVCLFEQTRENNSVLGDVIDQISTTSTEIKTHHQEEVQNFVEELKKSNQTLDDAMFRRIANEKVMNFLNSLDMDTYKETVEKILHMEKEYKTTSRKRKIETQTYYPHTKKSKQS